MRLRAPRSPALFTRIQATFLRSGPLQVLAGYGYLPSRGSKAMKRRIFVWAISAMLICSVGQATAGVIYSNLGPGESFGAVGYVIGGGFKEVVAAQFIPAITGESFSDALVALGLRSGTNDVLVSLETDSGGLPSVILESIDLVGAMSTFSSPSVVTATSVLHPALVAGTPYWLVVSAAVADSDAAWFLKSTGVTTPSSHLAFNDTGSLTGPWIDVVDSVPIPAFEVDGAAAVTPSVPEPAGLALFGIGAVAMIGCRWRRKHAA